MTMELLHGRTFKPLFLFSNPINKQHPPLVVLNLFSPNPRENFPISYSRCRTLETLWDNTESIRHVAVSSNDNLKPPELIFNRLQVSDEEYIDMQRRSFGSYIAREAVLNEEYWMAAWLRAEAHWETSTYKRHAETFKMKYADQEFKALKKRCSGQDGNMLQSFCLVAVKKEVKNMKRTVINSIVGTMDLSIRQYWQGETYPGEVKRHPRVLASKQPFDLHKYAYISNVVVAKYARRRGIASNMLGLATHIATSIGMKKLFVHVTTDNKPAQEVYRKGGFQIMLAGRPAPATLPSLGMTNNNNIPNLMLGRLVIFRNDRPIRRFQSKNPQHNYTQFAMTDASSNGELLMWMEL